MSKTDVKEELYVPSNDEVLESFLTQFDHTINVKKTFKSTIQNDFLTDKSVFELEIKDVSDYFKKLNAYKNLALDSKKQYLHRVITFVKSILNDYAKHFPILERLEFKDYLNDRSNFNWNSAKFHKKPVSNKKVRATKEELVKLCRYFKNRDFQKYLMVRIMVNSGVRKDGVCKISLNRVDDNGNNIPIEDDLEKRIITVMGKFKEEVYYLTEDLAKLLLFHAQTRRDEETECDALFISNHGKYYHPTTLNVAFKNARQKQNIKQHITPHTLRRTINSFRKLMGCQVEDRKSLLNHKENDTNIESYTILKYNEFLALYDKYNPYKNLTL